MQKIKVPMRCKLEHFQPDISFRFPYERQLRITLIPEPITQSFITSEDTQVAIDYTRLLFDRYIHQFSRVNMQNLYAVRHLLTSANVDNVFDMITLTKQLLPMLDEVIAQADPDNYELEIIK